MNNETHYNFISQAVNFFKFFAKNQPKLTACYDQNRDEN
ncbi:hypothetical protein COI_1644 [Mannheimia haemolytica serotype A2 str. OVINE]|nr:hypothetical protein COI_1644 [Mannheimia haemolytica serotype A2 str. OVINE]